MITFLTFYVICAIIDLAAVLWIQHRNKQLNYVNFGLALLIVCFWPATMPALLVVLQEECEFKKLAIKDLIDEVNRIATEDDE